MTDNQITPFSVKADKDEIVEDLKKLINSEKTDDFSDVDADKLTLWHVSIPLVPLTESKPIVLSKTKSATELDLADDLSDVFEEKPPKKTIHIIVQRPPQGNTDALSLTRSHQLAHCP
ncbi:hypothetical protein BGZ82_011319 [Podila clonocystis]|nr:hypothetical protein BGZ82_011319 [Podila clonocystis]